MHDDVRDGLRSVVAITVTPFDDAGRLDETAYSAVASRVAEAGVGVLTPNGNTSEFYSLTGAELNRAVALTLEAALITGIPLVGMKEPLRTLRPGN